MTDVAQIVAVQDWEYDDSPECANCGGEGFTYGCSWDWQCDTYDEGEDACLCTRRCDWCNPPKQTAENDALREIVRTALLSKEGESADA